MKEITEKNTFSISIIAKGSLGEVETYLLLAKDLGYLSEKDYMNTSQIREETGRIIKGLIRALGKKG